MILRRITRSLAVTYLPAIDDAWATQDLSAKYGIPAVDTLTSPVAVYHDGYTGVYTTDTNGHVQETYLPAIGDAFAPKFGVLPGGTAAVAAVALTVSAVVACVW